MTDKKILTNSILKPFRQHGFLPNEKSGTSQVIGKCLFCERDNKLFINIETQLLFVAN